MTVHIRDIEAEGSLRERSHEFSLPCLSEANAINNAGVVVGDFNSTLYKVHAFRWANGTMADLGVEGADSNSWATAINDAGQIAGSVERTPGGGFGCPARWSPQGVLTDLGGADDHWISGGAAIDPAGRPGRRLEPGRRQPRGRG